jgi:hypothetical protein
VVAIPRGDPSERVETTCAVDGTFRLVVASADEDRDLEVTHEEFGRRTFRVRPSRRGNDAAEVSVGDLVLERAGSLSGTLRIAGGGPGGGFEVVLNGPLFGVTPTSEFLSPGHQFALRRAREDGTFEFDRLAPGRYAVEVHPPPERGLAEVRHEIDLAAGEHARDVVLLLRPTGQVEITVVDGDGRPVKGLGVSIQPQEEAEGGEGESGPDAELGARARRAGAKTAATGPDGRVTFSNASPGRWIARVDGQGARTEEGQPSEFTLEGEAGTVRLTIVVRPAGAISGRVVDGDGAPIVGIAVVATALGIPDDAAPQVRTAITGPGGAFTIGGLLEAEYRIDVMDLAAPPESQVLASRDAVAAGESDLEIAVAR